MSNTITARFPEGLTETVANEALEQWAYGQILKFEGLDLPPAYQVDFSNFEFCGDSIPRIGDAEGVHVPLEVLNSGLNVYAFIWIQTPGSGRRQYRAMIRVIPGPIPDPETPNPEEESLIAEAIGVLNDATARMDAGVIAAEESAAAAEQKAAEAESWAVGGTGTRPGEDIDNAKFYAEKAEQSADTSGWVHFYIDENGHLIYVKTPLVELNFSLVNGHLYLEV